MMAAAIARPAGEAGVSMISSAAGRFEFVPAECAGPQHDYANCIDVVCGSHALEWPACRRT